MAAISLRAGPGHIVFGALSQALFCQMLTTHPDFKPQLFALLAERGIQDGQPIRFNVDVEVSVDLVPQEEPCA